MIRSASLIIILVCGAATLRGQATPRVAPTDRVYRDIDRLAAAGLIDTLIVGARPFSEREIVRLLAQSNSNKDIANRLNLSLHTVETHRWRIMEKLDLHGIAELVLSAVRRGLVT